ncbi:23S rRNA (pseudouridine(1915)-N(3))-methyltransferase RlmH [Ferroacidibacillus organovorans]|uniref:Ribosomal RNA large subunit methyltransferase H n=1 Tax=Ferroacidibacillus organovorans TaxID=1765683 RepID=A0A162UPM1_9BACL|nr:23S rRNA (pseudouridine(1915)-N(3))-methyltransferase RlmH [Ferroacidibacillus organovorans]KYP81935.1 23S rRNA (pseudouridine(1915)-N(3))-methyltransferase RlmH [Ferroacidibacillus organovorans]OAG94910.1 23S rRNA (pseudouridine(1915)-N(3))-methyltransferase RlmH [Ferroacidibacillus organovorans]OPG15011.1 23S rRNA (pseudouridine(1915)-N(3))-methyltransferase RlmH [Ferroacidibacillus organovorans]
MQIVIVAVGKVKERYWRDAEAEYRKRLSPYATVQVVEVADEADGKDMNRVLDEEGARILSQLRERDYVVALAIDGEVVTSPQLAARLERMSARGSGRYVFIIGGSNGLSPAVLQRSDWHLSFSALTFPHQMMRTMLLEQIYRAFRIKQGASYHK